MSDLMEENDLVNNPTPRIPICLCLDTSSSMNRIIGGTVQKTGKQVEKDGVLWDVVKGGITSIDDLNEGVKTFYQELLNDDVAQYSAEICIVTFGGTKPKIVTQFQTISSNTNIPKLVADGDTPIGEAVNLALDLLETRKSEYKNAGVDYYQPWLVLMTDGTPEGSKKEELDRAIERTSSLVLSKKLAIFPIGIGDKADMETLSKFSPKRTPLYIKNLKFKEFFQWLSQSVSRTSMSMPGENISLDKEGIKSWGNIDD